jgi:hypothetical protein
MKFALYCRGKGMVVEYPTMDEVWQYARANGLCSDEITNEDLPPRRILDPKYEIHTFASNGELIAMTRVRLTYASENDW